MGTMWCLVLRGETKPGAKRNRVVSSRIRTLHYCRPHANWRRAVKAVKSGPNDRPGYRLPSLGKKALSINNDDISDREAGVHSHRPKRTQGFK